MTNKTNYYELKAYAAGKVYTRRYYGNEATAAAERWMDKNSARVASVEAVSYAGVSNDFFYLSK